MQRRIFLLANPISILTVKELMSYTEDTPSNPAMDRTLNEGDTRSADDAQAKASPPHAATCPRADVSAQLAIDRPVCDSCSKQLQRFLSQTGLKPSFTGASLEPTSAQRGQARLSREKIRGLREVAVAAATGVTRTHAEAEFRKGIIYVTLIEPRNGETIRQHLVARYLARCAAMWDDPRKRLDESGYVAACQRLRDSMRFTRYEQDVIWRIEMLENDLARGNASWELRRKIGKIVMEVKSR